MKKIIKICLTVLSGSFLSSISFASSNFEENNSAFKQNVLYRIKNDENQSFLTFNTYGIAEFARDPQYSGKQITFNELSLFYIVPTNSKTTFNVMQNGAYLSYNNEKVTKKSGSLFKINLNKYHTYDNKIHYYINADSGEGAKLINCKNAFSRSGDKNNVSLEKDEGWPERHKTFLIEEYLPTHPEDQFNLGRLYLQTRNYEYAKKFLQDLYNNPKYEEKITQLLIEDEDYVRYHILGKTIYSDNTNIILPIPRLLSSSTTIKKGQDIIVDENILGMELEYCNIKKTPRGIMHILLKKDPFLSTPMLEVSDNLMLIQYHDGRINISDTNSSLWKPSGFSRFIAHKAKGASIGLGKPNNNDINHNHSHNFNFFSPSK